ncbi:post-PEP-CTERM-1 domain-containing protein [Rhodanobacter lindaniclasticus]
MTVQGVQVAIDPATGQLVAPTAEQRAALSRAMLEQSAAAPAARSARRANAAPRDEAEARQTLHTIRLQNGGHALGMEVPESLMSSLAAERRADGSLSIHHQGESGQAAAEVTQ